MCFARICKFLHLEKYLRCRFAHFVHDGFSHICRFAHLHFALVQKVCEHVLRLCRNFRTCENILRMCANMKFTFFTNCTRFFTFWAKSTKSRKSLKFPKMSDSVPSVFDVFPKMSEKSSRVPEWYTSGSWANAFDNTGWQKSPEYALIRIAAGAPDLAKSPNPPPDGPGRPRKSRHFSLRTEKLPDSAPGLAFAPQAEILSGAVFPDPRTTRPSRQTDSEARRVLRQSPTHSANVRTLRKTLAENRRQGQRHSCTPCTPCTPETQPCTLVHTAPQLPTQVAENTSSMCCSCWEEGGAERPRAIEISTFVFFVNL